MESYKFVIENNLSIYPLLAEFCHNLYTEMLHYRYFIVMQFNGKNYHGWQLQPNSLTVQAELNEKLGILLKMPVETTGAGRTDAGVHANYFVAHFDSPINIDSMLFSLSSKLNNFLSKAIYVDKIVPVGSNAHARFDAIDRTYKYYIATKKDVFNQDFSWHIFCKLDTAIMNKGAEVIMEYNDFTSFSKLHSDVKSYLCTIKSACWTQEGDHLIFTITADRFLRNMVRAIVGTLIDLGRHKIDLNHLRTIIEAKSRSFAGESAPSRGLFLHHISYPYPL